MKSTFVMGVAIALLACGLAAWSYPSLTGPTGQAVIPTGNIAAPGLTLAGDWQKLESGDAFPLRLLYAFGSSIEIGGTYDPFGSDARVTEAKFGDIGLSKAWSVNAKAGVTKFMGGDMAVGGVFRRETMAQPTTSDFDTDYTQGYLVWTDRLPYTNGSFSNFALTLGGNWTKVSSGIATVPDSDAIRGFAGLGFNLSKDFAIEGDIQTRASRAGDAKAISAGVLRFGLNPNVVLEGGLTNAVGLRGTNRHDIFVGVDFSTMLCK